jgi:hypothetical protein
MVTDTAITDLDYRYVSEVPDYMQVRTFIEQVLSFNKYDLLIIDGVLDISPGLNDETGCKEAVNWLRSIAVKHDLGLVTTLHPNKGTDTAAGHLGGFLYRFCRAMLLIRPNSNDKAVKELTVDFPQGKLSHYNPAVFNPAYITWSDTDHMFISIEEPDKPDTGYNEPLMLEVLEDFRKVEGLKIIPSARFRKAYALKIGKSEVTAKRHISEATGKVIQLIGNTRNAQYAHINEPPF